MNDFIKGYTFQFDWKNFKNDILKDIPERYHQEYIETFDMKLFFEQKVI